MHHLQPVSIEQFNVLKDTIRRLRPTQYSGENIKSMITDFVEYADQLEAAGRYDNDLTLHILDSALKAGGIITTKTYSSSSYR